VQVRNGVEGPGALNDGVGAEHVQKTRTPPAGVDAAADAGLRLASVDGDADRLVYHFFDAAVSAGAVRLP
jgi:phosphoacetylglucosamine mutase